MSKATITELVKTLTALALSDDDGERQRLTDVLRKLNEQLTDEADKRQITLYCRPIRFNEKDVARMPKTLARAKHKFIHKLFCIYCIKGANNNE